MFPSTAVVVLAAVAAQTVSAHFGLTYPTWRADTLSDEDNSPYSQWTYPCAGAPAGSNRTDWPVAGGAVEVDLHHPWTYLFVNLGLGGNVSSNFNVSLTPRLLNVTGKGTLCLPLLPVPGTGTGEDGTGPSDGQPATLQVVTSGESGSALYNCADITFRANASAHQCTNSSGVTVQVVGDAAEPVSDGSVSGNGTGSDDGTNTAVASTVGTVTLGVIVTLAVVFAAA